MDIIEFAEKIYDGQLPLWQKELLKKYKALPPDSKLVYCGGVFHVIKNNETQENKIPEITHEYSLGLASKLPVLIDECHDYFLDPMIVFEKDGGIRITEISLVRKPQE